MTMENSDDIRLIVKIAQLYYEQDMTQAQIARELGIYRTTISRLLKRGREQGIVTIAINYDYNENLWLEQQLKQKWEEYSSLPAEEKEKLKQESTNKPAIKPSAPATPTLLPPTPVTAKHTVSEIVQLPQPAVSASTHEQSPQTPATPSAETTTTAP